MYFGFFFFFGKIKISFIEIYSEIIKDRYGESVLKLVRKFKRTDLCCRKAELDFSFLKYCFENSLTLKF